MDEAQHAIEYNNIAYKHNIAPKVYSDEPFDVENILPPGADIYYKYGIICGRVQMTKPSDFKNGADLFTVAPGDGRYENLVKKYQSVFPDTFDDLHLDNIGLKDGHLVVVDFGMMSTDSC
ncbi:MAG TPA: hypothetical protein ENH82_11835 [bacterium]|nr:hypothetical protein [bacterium]